MSKRANSEPKIPATDEESALRRPPQQARGERRVAGLLDAAAAVIAEVGVAAASAEAIARRAGTAKGSLYQFFPNADAIVSALAARYATELATVYAASFGAAEAAATVPELVDRVLEPLAAFHDRNPAFRHVFEVARQARDEDGTGRLVGRLRLTVVERIERLLQQLDPQLAEAERRRHARVVQTMGQALLYLRAESPIDERPEMLRAVRDALVRYLSGVITTGEGRPRRRGSVRSLAP
jgi:AcrR family transcriptional regulator